MLEFACPKCNDSIRANEDQAGDAILCPRCSQQIKVPGSAPGKPVVPADDWSVFDEEEKFIEESIATSPKAHYRTPSELLEPLVDNDEEMAREEEKQEQQAAVEKIIQTKSVESQSGTGAASDLTMAEKVKQEEEFEKLAAELPRDSPLVNQTAWTRDPAKSPDAIQLDNQGPGKLRATCHVCDSVSMVGEEKGGTTIACPDCGTHMKVPLADEIPGIEKQKQQHWENWVQQDKVEPSAPQPSTRKLEEELFADAAAENEEYGLAPPPDNLLTPVLPVYPTEDEPEYHPDSVPEHPAPHNRQQRETGPLPATQPSPSLTEPVVQASGSEKDSGSGELPTGQPTVCDRLPLRQHLTSILTDPGFLFRVLISSMLMMVGFSIFHFPAGLAASDSYGMSLLGRFLQMFSLPLIPIGFLTVCWVGQQTLNATIVGQKKLPEIGSASALEWFSDCLFVAFGLAIGCLPGMLLGTVLWALLADYQGFWSLPGCASFSGMLLAPLLILSAMHNRSPFHVVSKTILDSIKRRSDFWIEFYIAAAVLAGVTGLLWFLGLTENWLVVVLMLLAVNLCFGLYFRLLGRLMDKLVNPAPKKTGDDHLQSEQGANAEE